MNKEINNALTDEVKEGLTEESLSKLEQHFNEKVKLHVEKALNEQDEEYSVALEKFLGALDADHSNKLKKVVEAIELNHTNKLKRVVAKYEQALTEDANKFRSDLVSKISNYLDLYLEKTVPQDTIIEAVNNKRAVTMLDSIRSALGVDLALAKESVREAVLDGKNQINEARTELEDLKSKFIAMEQENASLKSRLYLEQKTAGLSDQKKGYVKKILSNKSYDFVKENYDYTISMFDKREEEKLQDLTEEAKAQAVTGSVDRVVVEEKTFTQPTQTDNSVASVYVAELRKY